MQLAVTLLISITVLITGIVSVFFKDLAWEFTERSNSARGVDSKRTEAWETGSTIGGIITIIAGIVLIFAALSIYG